MHLKNLSNEYLEYLERGVFDEIPKSVFAAIAVSYLVNHGTDPGEVTQEILHEWEVLHLNGIVPQKPKVRPTTNAADICPTCRGSGHVDYAHNQVTGICKTCNGTGKCR